MWYFYTLNMSSPQEVPGELGKPLEIEIVIENFGQLVRLAEHLVPEDVRGRYFREPVWNIMKESAGRSPDEQVRMNLDSGYEGATLPVSLRHYLALYLKNIVCKGLIADMGGNEENARLVKRINDFASGHLLRT